jgi:hypothetical protein
VSVTLQDYLKDRGYPTGLPCDGEFHRFDRTRPLSGWFVGRRLQVQGEEMVVARFGDWASDERHEYRSGAEGVAGAQVEEELLRLANEEREAREQLQLHVSEMCASWWAVALERGESPYLKHKGLQGLFGCRLWLGEDYKEHTGLVELLGEGVAKHAQGVELLVPARDIQGKLWGIQRILPQKTSSGLGKIFTPGMRIKGCFHLIGEIDPEGVIYVCEGIATGASIFLGTGRATACAFNAGNLGEVAARIRDRYRSARLVICGDDDRWTTRPDGTPWNPGREKADAAARLVGGTAVYPHFTDLSSRPTDFNDLHILDGLASVKSQLENLQAVAVSGEMPGLQPLAWGVDKKGNPTKPPRDQDVADALLDFYADRIVAQGEDLFIFTGTHWRHVDRDGQNVLLRQIQHLYSGEASINKMEAIFKLFLTIVPGAPVDMFLPRFTTANFLDGTLHAVRGADYKYVLEFRPHRREDYVTSVIPLEYRKAAAGARNQEFEEMLDRVFEDTDDGRQRRLALRQLYGACLMPLYPRLFLLHSSVGGTGKSSVIIPAMRLVAQENWCSVEPHEFTGFLMESMVGKLINVVTDISLNQAIDDGMLKKIEDRIPVRIDRKFQTPVYAPLPAVHIFGANGIPRTLEGGSGAHTRRWTFIEFQKYRAQGTAFRKDFANWVFEQEPHGVLAFALSGLQDLVASDGHFLTPDSGKERMAEWQRDNDPIGSFIHDAGRGELDQNSKLMVLPEAQIRTSDLYEVFKVWSTTVGYRAPPMNRMRFHAAVRDKGFKTKTVKGRQYYSGIGHCVEPSGVEASPGAIG